MTYRLKEIRVITGQIKTVTGLRIGGNAESMEISGQDNPILRDPATNWPFIPGSSIRGKMRSLLEWQLGEIPPDGNVIHADAKGQVTQVFGISAKDNINAGPTRLIVRDAYLAQDSQERYLSGLPLTESKSENSINRLNAKANPRPMERVVPGILFDLELVYRIFEGFDGRDDDQLFSKVVLVGLKLLELDALGGGSSRGNGKIRLVNLKCNGLDLKLPQLVGAGVRS